MRPYNPMTVLRQSSRNLLEQFFTKHNCPIDFGWQSGKFYELQNAFNRIGVQHLVTIDRAMRDVFFFASSDDMLTQAIEAVEAQGYQFSKEFAELRTRYDKALYIYMNHRDVWDSASLFAHSDQLSSQHWYRLATPPGLVAKHDQETLTALGNDISAYFWQNQQRGKNHLVEYQERHNGLSYFFVYLSDYSDIYEKWEGDAGEESKRKMVRREECRVFNIVFIYNPDHGMVETFCMGGQKHAKNLQSAFCHRMFNADFKSELTIKNNYLIDQLKFRKNQLSPNVQLGVFNPRIYMMELCVPGIRCRRHRIMLENSVGADEIYNVFEHDLDPIRYPMSILKVCSIGILLDVMMDGHIRTLCIIVKGNTCTLKSNFEELRTIGEQYLLEEGIDVQPKLL